MEVQINGCYEKVFSFGMDFCIFSRLTKNPTALVPISNDRLV